MHVSSIYVIDMYIHVTVFFVFRYFFRIFFRKVSVEAGRQRTDAGVPAPVKSFKHAGFDDLLLSEVVRQGFEAPTPIQAQALPVVMSVSAVSQARLRDLKGLEPGRGLLRLPQPFFRETSTTVDLFEGGRVHPFDTRGLVCRIRHGACMLPAIERKQ